MANPIVSRTELMTGGVPMTVAGVIKKTALLLGLSATAGFGLFFYALLSGMSAGALIGLFVVAMLATMGIGLTCAFKPHLSKALAVPYALLEGVVLGVASAFAFYKAPSVPLLALSATFVTAAVMLTLYVTGIIKVTQKFRSLVVSASIAIFVVYAIQWIMRLVFGSTIPYLFDGGMIAIGFSVFTTLIASFFLLIDFKNIEDGVMYGVNQDFEWNYGIGVLATLVWMYIEFLRLIGYLQE
ncbi:MAG: Bax inhibitor-1/YccA family protein [Moraxella sp.]|uniref:Bax inhibitor-1/YccA family protein n=1 Tax=Moraxella sp. TaxID=479 RepID=UPI0026DD377E|nr:Bax inhibitor-1/YccA family protein [Moraxella sp.]MDO4450396.1 Bax inhibitor-1/YccA family protein [Moraxella sp.]